MTTTLRTPVCTPEVQNNNGTLGEILEEWDMANYKVLLRNYSGRIEGKSDQVQ